MILNEGLEVLGTNDYPDDWNHCGVFRGSSVESVILPSTLKRIERYTFYDCKNLKNIRLPEGLEFIGPDCFDNSALESVELPASLRIISQGAFENCKNLKTVKFSEGLEVLGTDDGERWFGVF